jgi:hypothetical protein
MFCADSNFKISAKIGKFLFLAGFVYGKLDQLDEILQLLYRKPVKIPVESEAVLRIF